MRVVYLIYFVSLSTSIYAGVTNDRKEVGHGGVKQIGEGPKKENGRVQFQENIDVEIDIKGQVKRRVNLKKQRINTNEGIGIKESAVYADSTVLLRRECSNDGTHEHCKDYALVKGDDATTYVNAKGKTLRLPNKEGELDVATPAPHSGQTAEPKQKSSLGGRRQRRAIGDALTESRVIKLIMFADKGLIDLFMTFNDDDKTAAKDDIKFYLCLVANEMTVSYQTLMGHDRPMTVNGVLMEMDVAVTLVGVEFPPDDSPSGNFDFAESNVADGDLYAITTVHLDSSVTYDGILGDFQRYLKDEYNPESISYDHAMFVTGYNFVRTRLENDGTETSSNLLGLAWSDTLCKTSQKNYGYHSSVNEIHGYFVRVASHELGHGFGMRHDPERYIMKSSIFHPKGSDNDTYYAFSSFSADNVEDYTASISVSNFEDTCLQTPSESFFVKFCEGFISSEDGLSFDEQCKMMHGSESYRYPDSNSVTESNLQAGYVEICIATDTFSLYPFRCKNTDATTTNSYWYGQEASHGTKCLSPDGSRGDFVCYQGQCMSNVEICSTTTTTTTVPTTTTTTTTEPTTTTTTTEPTTTTTTTEPTTTTTTTEPTTTTTTTEPTTTTTTTEPTTTTTTTEPTTTTTTTEPTTTTTTTEPTTTTTTTEPTTTTTTTEPTTTTTTTDPTTTTTTTEPTTTTTTTEPTTTTTTTEPTTTTTTTEPTTTTTTTEPTTTTTTTEPTTTTTTTEPTTTTTTTEPTTTTTTTEPTTTTTTTEPTTTTTTTEPTTTTTTTEPTTTTPSVPCECTTKRCCRTDRNDDLSCCTGCQKRGNNCSLPRKPKGGQGKQ